MNGIKPSHYRTPRTLQECTFQVGYKGGIDSDKEEGKSWALILGILLFLCILLSFALS